MAHLLTNARKYRRLPIRITSVGRFTQVPVMAAHDLQPNSLSAAAWPANNLAVYHELILPEPFIVARFFVMNGNATGNIDIGLMDASGNKLISTGSSGRTGSSVNNYFGVTDQGFPAGKYFLALVVSTTSGTVNRLNHTANIARSLSLFEESLGATALPSTFTPAAYGTSANVYEFGFSQSDSL